MYSKALNYAYHRLGIRSAIPVMPAMMLLWEIMTPLGMPVDPLVYMMTAMSEGSGRLHSSAAANKENTRTVCVSASFVFMLVVSLLC